MSWQKLYCYAVIPSNLNHLTSPQTPKNTCFIRPFAGFVKHYHLLLDLNQMICPATGGKCFQVWCYYIPSSLPLQQVSPVGNITNGHPPFIEVSKLLQCFRGLPGGPVSSGEIEPWGPAGGAAGVSWLRFAVGVILSTRNGSSPT